MTELNSSTGLTEPVVNCCAALLAADIRALCIRALSSLLSSPGVLVFSPSDPDDTFDCSRIYGIKRYDKIQDEKI